MKVYSKEEFERIYGKGTAGDVGKPQDENTYIQRLKQTFGQGIEQAKTGARAISTAGTTGGLSPLPLFRGAVEGAIGLGRAATSWASAALEPAIEPTIGRGFREVTERISDIPAVQRFAESPAGVKTERFAQDLANLAELAGYVIVPRPALTGVRTATQAGIEGVAGGLQGARQAIPAVSRGLGQAAETISGVAATGLEQAGQIPGRIATNVAESRALQQAIEALPRESAKQAARNGVDIADITLLNRIATTEAPAVQRLWQSVRDFSSGVSDVNPVEIIGEPIVNRLKTLQTEARRVGSLLGQEAKNLGDVTPVELQPSVLTRLQQVPGLEGLKVSSRNVLDFRDTVLATAETVADRNAIQSIYLDAIKKSSGYNKHLLRQELFESLGGKRRANLVLTETTDKAYNAIRDGLADALEQQSLQYKQLSSQYRAVIQPVKEMAKYLTKAGNEQDLMNLSAGLLARRLTSNAVSNPEIRKVLRAMDQVMEQLGKREPSVEALQDAYNVLNRYYNIAPETGFQGQIQAGIEGATGISSYLMGQMRELMGVTPAVKREAFEAYLNDLLNATPEGPAGTTPTTTFRAASNASDSTVPSAAIPENLIQEAKKYDNLTDYLEAQQGQTNVLYRGAGDAEIRDNQFWGDFYRHAEEYAGGAEEIAQGNGVVVGAIYNPDDVYYFRPNEIQDIYSNLTDAELKQIYTKPIKEGVFGNAQMSYDISDRQVIPLIKKYLSGKISEDEISNDFLIPLYQKYAKTKGKSIIAFEGSDFGGSTEYVVSDIKKLINLNEVWDKVKQ